MPKQTMEKLTPEQLLEAAYRLAGGLFFYPEDREDAAQEAAIAAWRAGETADANKAPRTYQWEFLRGYLRHAHRKLLRESNHHHLRMAVSEEEHRDNLDSHKTKWLADRGQGTALDAAARKESSALDLLDTLDRQQRFIVTECVLKDRTLQAVGRQLGVTRERVRQLRDDALQLLRSRYERSLV
jgi:RNA polymerase sigma factor (sigma-70 family)